MSYWPIPGSQDALEGFTQMEQTQAVYETVEAPPEPLDDAAEEPADLSTPATRTRKKPSIPRVRLHTFDSFRYGNFRMLWGMTFSASAGWGIQEVVLGWLTYDLTRSALLTSLALGLGAVPFLLAGPLGGVLVDSWDRRRMLAAAMVYQALITVGFALVVIFERVEAWNILTFSFLMGLPWVVAEPTRMSLVARFVPKEALVNAFALNAMAFSATRLAAPAAGGLILGLVGPGPALLVQTALSAIGVALALSLRFEESRRVVRRIGEAFAGLREGAEYVRGQPMILGLLLLGAVPPVLVMPFVHGLMPVYAAEVFGVGPSGLGVLLTALGVGSAIGTITLATFGQVSRQGRLVVFSVAWLVLCMLVLTQIDSYRLVMPVLVLLGIGVSCFWATTTAAIQLLVDEEMRGRIGGLYMVTWGLFPAGSLLAGTLAETYGPPIATMAAAGLVAVSLAALLLRFGVVWRS